MEHYNSGMEYASRQHGDVSGVGSQLPMPLSKFQSNVSASRTSAGSTTNNHQMISEKKKLFEGQEHIVGHQLPQVKPSLPATATSTGSLSTASSSSMKKFFGRNKGYILTVCVCVSVSVSVCECVCVSVCVCVCVYTHC